MEVIVMHSTASLILSYNSFPSLPPLTPLPSYFSYKKRPQQHRKRDINITIVDVLKIALQIRKRNIQVTGIPPQEAKRLLIPQPSGSYDIVGTIKEVLGTCRSLNCTIDNKHPSLISNFIDQHGLPFLLQTIAHHTEHKVVTELLEMVELMSTQPNLFFAPVLV